MKCVPEIQVDGVSPIETNAPAASSPPSAEFLRQLDVRAPRYTSYPTADRFVEAFGPNDYLRHLSSRGMTYSGPLSVYVHIPFCESLCYFCGCNRVITKNHDKAPPYLSQIEAEIRLVSEPLSGSRELAQMHWGGGTPTFLRSEEIVRLMDALRGHFDFKAGGEYSIEIDPRAIDQEKIQLLAEQGFNRLSLGVQDFHPDVQRAVNRVQPFEMTQDALRWAREAGFESSNFDLIYGLPRQNLKRFSATVQQVIALRPDRIALYNYAHLPTRFRAQRQIVDVEIPSGAEKLAIFDMACEMLCGAGYVYIGMDHFALPDDELAVAQRAGVLHRNFQGYTTQPDCDLVSFGASAISKVGACYSQNVRSVADYGHCIGQGELPVLRGIELTRDDLARRSVIMGLMCQGQIAIESIEIANLLEFSQTFKNELEQLANFEQMGLLTIDSEWITVSELGRSALRAICAVFDKHLRASENHTAFSKVL